MWRSIRFKLVAVYLLLILFALQLIGAYFVRALTASLIHNATDAAVNQAQLIATIAAPQMVLLKANPGLTFSPILSSFPQLMNGAVYVLNSEGVVEDTSAGTALVGQKRIDSVVTQALVGHKRITAIRLDPVSQSRLLAVAVPMMSGGNFFGVVEDVVPIDQVYQTVTQVTTIFYTSSLIVLALTAFLGIILSRALTQPVLDVIRQARTMASGDFSHRVAVTSQDEFGDLGDAINDLTARLQGAISANLHERERLKAVITYMGDGVIAFDPQLKPILHNAIAERLVSAEGPRAFQHAARTLGLSRKELETEPLERTFVKQLGDTLVSVNVTAIRKDDALEGYVAVLRDVTEQEKLNRARRDFVANVSHELRTPLTSIKSYLEVLQEGTDEATQSRFLHVIEQETDRMVRLTRDLLQLSGLDNRSTIRLDGAIDVSSWLGHTVERFRLQAERQGVEIQLDCDSKAAIHGNRDMLDRVLDNVMSNALRHTQSGGTVKIHANASLETVHIQFKDTGSGIPAEDLPHVFERFYRVDKARSRRLGGTGLGLALAREITEQHGGRIAIDSEVNRGTTVTLLLPRLKEVSP